MTPQKRLCVTESAGAKSPAPLSTAAKLTVLCDGGRDLDLINVFSRPGVRLPRRARCPRHRRRHSDALRPAAGRRRSAFGQRHCFVREEDSARPVFRSHGVMLFARSAAISCCSALPSLQPSACFKRRLRADGGAVVRCCVLRISERTLSKVQLLFTASSV